LTTVIVSVFGFGEGSRNAIAQRNFEHRPRRPAIFARNRKVRAHPGHLSACSDDLRTTAAWLVGVIVEIHFFCEEYERIALPQMVPDESRKLSHETSKGTSPRRPLRLSG
jgi:hypothetical protein